ncbi:hypothetical protein ppKF707_2141 [Metapseudomonas furukawaii]|uniref:Uncharacterized protein n=1 Tax=Metapseudomonas furukawaii TaxID=1149133 RepID=A0AAD1FGS7_METFU|nr:hypothetical protein ppKF707_2141 [Pseudomonas furukawaii]BAU74743.1 hypothetical protein KF707C_30550 [Pseudomonas furukawaii]
MGAAAQEENDGQREGFRAVSQASLLHGNASLIRVCKFINLF